MIEIIGGVSPLKARQSSRGGKRAGKATATSKRRGGFAKSKGKRGAGGRNVGGYNVQTRFKADKWVPPPSGGTTYMSKPYSFDKEGNLQVNPPGTDPSQTQTQTQTPGTPGSPEEGKWIWKEGQLPSYKQAWDEDLEGITTKYSSFEDYVADIEGQKKMAASEDWEGIANKKGISVEQAKKDWEKRKVNGRWVWVKTKDAVASTSGTQSQSQTQTN